MVKMVAETINHPRIHIQYQTLGENIQSNEPTIQNKKVALYGVFPNKTAKKKHIVINNIPCDFQKRTVKKEINHINKSTLLIQRSCTKSKKIKF